MVGVVPERADLAMVAAGIVHAYGHIVLFQELIELRGDLMLFVLRLMLWCRWRLVEGGAARPAAEAR